MLRGYGGRGAQRELPSPRAFQLVPWRRKGKDEPPRSVEPQRNEQATMMSTLPLEIRLMILDHLQLSDILRLRQVCHSYRHVITAEFVQQLFTRYGQPDAVLQGCCIECLMMPGVDRVLLDVNRGHGQWRSVCFNCWRSKVTANYQRKHGSLLELATGEYAYMCPFCAWPVNSVNPDGTAEIMHPQCRRKRFFATVVWFVMAIIQVGLGVLALVMSVTVYRHVPTVLIPTMLDFGMSIIALTLFMIRSCTSDEQKYAYALSAELFMTIVRIPPVCYTARETVRSPQLGVLPKFSLGVFLLNLILRYVDTLGYTLLYFGYDPRSMFRANLSRGQKYLYYMCTFIVWCAFIPN
ncbi:hypothetical protein BX600DRAFT_506205 [Xylariales sp. PMI_506]|nr:hypothetical protein BX600DRAFT_506205 [Xylariales sp. PMI_506]